MRPLTACLALLLPWSHAALAEKPAPDWVRVTDKARLAGA